MNAPDYPCPTFPGGWGGDGESSSLATPLACPRKETPRHSGETKDALYSVKNKDTGHLWKAPQHCYCLLGVDSVLFGIQDTKDRQFHAWNCLPSDPGRQAKQDHRAAHSECIFVVVLSTLLPSHPHSIQMPSMHDIRIAFWGLACIPPSYEGGPCSNLYGDSTHWSQSHWFECSAKIHNMACPTRREP